ncbi:MAG: Ni,Fe-hydrogenase I large subunit [Desulfobacteraceae bacterium IS3]|nr:MAG: Ni,Fe-hydrogenase I large subunit [Desulfobacteraceae bacterium IS3]HAO20308.1 Ni,Fe-hydrogenase I large subunit [Desulfobacteraceae bacterium]
MKRIFPMNRVEGDLKITLETDKGVVSEAWSSGTMYRGFENIMLGRGSLDGLVITPRICGICSTSHLYAAAKALDMICQTDIPDNAVRVRNICLMTEMIQNDVRHAALLFMPDFCNSRYADSQLSEEAFRRYAQLKGQMAIETIRESKKLIEIIAILGGQWPHSSFMVPGGVVCVPGATDISNCRYLLNTFRRWYEKRFLGCGIERWSEVRSMADLNVWLDESESHRNSELGFFIRFSKEAGLDKIGRGCGHFISFGALDMPDHTEIKSLNGGKTLLPAGFDLTPFHQRNITEDISHSWFGGPSEPKHPFEGVTKPYATGSEDKRYSWAKAPRYEGLPAETGPLADMIIAGHPLLLNLAEISGGVSVFTRQLARMIRPALLIPFADIWLKEISAAKENFFKDYEMPESGDGFGLTQAPRGAVGHWVKIRDSQIEKYQIITPTAWNASPRDSNGFRGPWEEALIGVEIRDDDNPIEAQHIIRSFDPCLVCTVHAIHPSPDPSPERRGESSIYSPFPFREGGWGVR